MYDIVLLLITRRGLLEKDIYDSVTPYLRLLLEKIDNTIQNKDKKLIEVLDRMLLLLIDKDIVVTSLKVHAP